VSEELKPCPFCGCAARYTYNDFYNNNSMAQCVSCGASAFWKKWNERAEPRAQPEPESACNPADICAGCRCEYSQSAAPTPDERADADTAWAIEPIDILLDRLKSGGDYTTPLTTPQAECAPREAQPVDQWLRDLRRAHEYLDKGEPFFTGKDCAELADLIESLAAPTPERADADTAGASDERIEELIEQSGGFWVDDEFRINCRDLTQLIRDASQERADAGKDAERYRWLRQRGTQQHTMQRATLHGETLDRNIDAAILAANKEPK
jgi:hypothetical protein